MGGLSGAPPDREHRQSEEVTSARLPPKHADRIAAGHDDTGPGPGPEAGVRYGFDAKQRSDDDLMAARPQGRRGAFAIGLGPGDEEQHANQAEATAQAESRRRWLPPPSCTATPRCKLAAAGEDCTS